MNPFSSQISRHHSVRLKNYDYSSAGAYFVTICTQNHECLFGQISVGAGPCARPQMFLSEAGRMIRSVWHEIPSHYPGNDIDKFVVMPNHIHGILIVGAGPRACPENKRKPKSPCGQPQGVAPTGLSLPDIVHRFKTMTTKQYADGVKQLGWQPFYGKLWQRSYYEHVIRDEDELNEIRQYILTNPLKWALDRENPEYGR
jgi:putative transposase